MQCGVCEVGKSVETILWKISDYQWGRFHDWKLGDKVFVHINFDNDVVFVVVFGIEQKVNILDFIV